MKTAILLAMFALALASLRGKSPTFDEQSYITRGVAYLRGENRHLRVGHPLGLNALNSLFLAFDRQVALPTDDPSWQETSFHRPSELFLWEIGNDVERIMFLSRLPTIWLGLLLVAIGGRWAWEMASRDLAGMLAMLLLALDPNILAHTRLTTTDVGLAAAALLAGYMLWRFWRGPGWTRAVLAGGAFGLLLNTKFTAGLFIPLFALVILIAFLDRWRKPRGPAQPARLVWRPLLLLLVCYPLASFFVLWATNDFQFGTLPVNLPTLPKLAGTTLPLSHYVEQLLDIGGRVQKATPSFLMGQYSDAGWWYYFPVVFALKTPLPTLILLAWALVRLVLCGLRRIGQERCLSLIDAAALLVPSLGYFAFALTTDINLGYRHLLPILPFLMVFVSVMISGARFRPGQWRARLDGSRLALAALLIWLVMVGLWIYPHYLTYFNALAGGPDGGWRHLVDSNIDWGQDLAGLKSWMDNNQVDEIWLSYFGEARPDYYGISYQGLDSFPPRLMNPEAQPYFPADPAPGTYAISATNLQGVHFTDHDQFAWFRTRDPADKIGNSMFIYAVPFRGDPVALALGGLQLDEIDPEDYATWASNDVTARWFDPAQSLVLPPASRTWLVLDKNAPIHPRVAQEIETWQIVQENSEYRIYRRPTGGGPEPATSALFERDSSTISLESARFERRQAAPGDILELETRWAKHGPVEPVKIFVHITEDDGEVVTQWDGLGAPWEGWREGDELLQLHQIRMPEDLPPGSYQVWIGLYEPASGQRWSTEDGDQFSLDEITIGQ